MSRRDKLPKVPSRRNDREVRNIRRVAAGGTPKKGPCVAVALAAIGAWAQGKGWKA